MSATPKYHTIFFDAGGTLIKANPSVGVVYSEVAKKYDIHVDPDHIERTAWKIFRANKLKERAAGGVPHTFSIATAKIYWRRVIRECFGAAADSPRFEAFYQAVFHEFTRPERYRIFPEVEPLLEDLIRSGFRLGIISNWDERLGPVLKGLGLAEKFQTVVISSGVKFEKPHPGIFEQARVMSGAPHDSPLLHVGDSLEDDYEAALAAGFDARLVDRSIEGQDLRSVLADLR